MKKSLKKGFILFVLGTFTLFVQFFLYFLQSNIAFTTDWIGYLYYFMAALGHASLFASVPYILFYIPFTFCIPFPRVNQGILIFIYFLLNIIAYVDGVVFQLYKFHINGLVIDMLFGDNASQVFVFNSGLIMRVIFTFLLLTGLFAGIVYAGYKLSTKVTSRQIKIYIIVFVCCIVGSHLVHGCAAAVNQSSIQNVVSCLPQFYPMTFNSFLLKHGLINKENLNTDFKEKSFNAGVIYPLHPLQFSDSITKKNIIFILLDSWNNLTFNEINCPNIYNFSKCTQSFTHHLSSSNGTRGSIFGMFFSASATYWKEFEIAGIHPLFIQMLLNQNYSIETFPSATLMNPPFNRIIFGDVKDIRTETIGATPFDRDNQLTSDFLQYLDKKSVSRDEPFFAFLFYDLLHAIDIPEPYRHKFTPSWEYSNYMVLNNNMDPAPFFNLYRNCAWHVDSLVGTVIEKLKTTGILENSVVVITGDHSQEFNENKKNYWGHGSNYSNAQVHVPMLYYDVDLTPGVFHHRTTHYDIVPTIMSRVLGITNPLSDYSMGQQLSDTIRPSFHIAGNEENYALITKDLIYEKKHSGRIVITDTLLNLVDKKLDPRIILDAIQYKNRFMKK